MVGNFEVLESPGFEDLGVWVCFCVFRKLWVETVTIGKALYTSESPLLYIYESRQFTEDLWYS